MTHNYSKAPGSESGFDIPELPEGIVQLNDGASIDVYDDGNFIVNN